MTESQKYVVHVRECWAHCPAIPSQALYSFALALKAEDAGDYDKADEYLAKAIEHEAKAA